MRALVLIAFLSFSNGAAAQCTGIPGANTICSGPASGSASFPGFRSIVTADIPAGAIVNSNLANMAANSIKANTTSGSAVPVDFGTATGTAQDVFTSYSVNSPGLDIASGSAASPITTQGPTIRFSRVENITPSVSVCSNNSVDNECNATVAIYSTGTSSDGMQNSALFAGAVSSSTVNSTNAALGATLFGRVTGSAVGTGVGAYMEGRRDTATGTSVGAEIRGSNFTATPGTYSPSGFSNTQSIWVTSNGNSVVGTGIGLGNAGQAFTVGIGATASSVTGQTFRDDTSATTSVQLNGSHTTGVDLTGGTFSGNAFQSPGYTLTGTGGTATQNPSSGAAALALNPAAASQQARIDLQQTNSTKWQVGKNTDNTFFIFDNTGGNNIMTGTPNAGLVISPKNAHTNFSGGTAPSLTSGCNGAGSSVSGSDTAGTIIGQTVAVTTCTLTFGTAYSGTPNCVASGQSSPLTGAFTVSTATLVVNFASTANYKWSYICFGT